MGNCCGKGQTQTHSDSLGPRVSGPKSESPRSPFDSEPAANGERSSAEAADRPPAHLNRLLSPTTSVRSGRSVYFDAEEGEDPATEGRTTSTEVGEDGVVDPEGKPSLWDMVHTALLPYRSTQSIQRDEAGRSPKLIGDDDDKAKVGCLTLGATSPGPERPDSARSSNSAYIKPEFGKSVNKRVSRQGQTASDDRSTAGIEVWEEADPCSFLVRGLNYAKDGKKFNSKGAIYSVLLGVDIYSFEQKISHIAKRINLPQPPKLGAGYHRLQGQERIPPILVINVQLPTYTPSMWGPTDGKGQSLVYYFSLPEGWEPEHLDNPAALALCQRFVHDGRESDKSATRDRMKLIARVANVEEWAERGPLSGTEVRLLRRYNDKPLLTRPQQHFYQGDGYLEVDLDVHAYAYIARRAFAGFTPRLSTVVFENGFVVQGNRAEELPELLLACARVARVDFNRVRPFPGKLRRTLSHRDTIIMDRPPRSTGAPEQEGSEQQEQHSPSEQREQHRPAEHQDLVQSDQIQESALPAPKDSASSHAHESLAQTGAQ